MEPVLVYDGACPMCTSAVERARAIAPGVRTVPYQSADLAALGLTAEQCARAVQWVDADGVSEGADAVQAVLRSGRRPWALLGAAMSAPGLRALSRHGYEFVARRRRRFSFARLAPALEPLESEPHGRGKCGTQQSIDDVVLP